MCLAAAVLAVLAGAAAAERAGDAAGLPLPATVSRTSTLLSSSVITFYDCEYVPHYGQTTSQCDHLLTNARKGGSSSVNLVPTHYWIASAPSNKLKPGQCYPDAWAANQTVDYYCSRWEWDAPCEPFSAPTIQRFAAGFRACLQKAHDMFDEVLISPHLDDGTKTGHWRNTLFFDPLQKDKFGNTYWDVMLGPIFQAVQEVYTQPGKTIIFGPEGEMGGTVFYAPAQYHKIIDRVRAEYKGPAKLKTALMFNHGYLQGVINRGPEPPEVRALPPSPMAPYQGWGPLLPFERWPEYARLKKAQAAALKLLDSADVLGVSCYPRAGATPKPADLESCAVKYDAELKAMGFDLKKWSDKPGKRFIYAEVGLGGGISRCGDTPARTRAQAGMFSWLDVGYPWSKANDVWGSGELRGYRREWHGALLSLLATRGRQYPISGSYLWSLMSLDPQGIHPATTSGGGTFSDAVIADAIGRYNRQVAAARSQGRDINGP